MNTTVRTGIDVVVRTAALLVGAIVYDRAWTWVFYTRTGDEPVGADIGEGLVAFALVAVVAAAWAAWDARRRSFGVLASTWLVTAVLVSLVAGLRAGVGDGDLVLSDLLVLSPFLIGLVGVPALLGGGLVEIVRSSRAPVR